MKETLKRVGPLVIAVRTLKGSRQLWKQAAADVQEDRRAQGVSLAHRRAIDEYLLHGPAIRKLQIGTGDNFLLGWLNTDLEPTLDTVAYLDALDVFPFEEGTFDYVFSEHMIEHITYRGGLDMLREAFRVLKPGGKIRISTPDADKIAGLLAGSKSDAQRQYIEWSARRSLGLYSREWSELQLRRTEWAIEREHFERFYPDIVNDSPCFIVNNFFRSYGHQFLHNEKTLGGALRAAGFVDVSRREPGESDDPNLCGIESHGRSIGEEMNSFETMVLEATRT